ncbi:putative disease resistance protein RGA3 [Rhodamnia argentea]|uniref:Disease resistance protein RGA3 n=1 Tax=Rhodamnia argentea TaxID=178133 RepID=A0ABM3HAD1_9MYRT|nr:putative disease resistance protein RGA3 [Rhodamnia argentea]
MAEAALFSLATDTLKSLATEIAKPAGSFVFRQIKLLCSAKDGLRSLEHTVQAIRAVLLDAEKQQWDKEQVKLWLKRLKDVLYDVQDLLDDVATEDLRRKVTPGNKMSKSVRIFFSKSNQLAQRLKVANKIQELRKTLDEIEKDSNLLNLERHPEETVAIGRGKKPEHPSPDEKIIGREEDKKKIKQLLLSSSSSQSLSFVAIFGKGGLGKTALARLVYNDGEVRQHFELKMWVCVSDVFDVNSIIKDILKKAKIDCQGHDDEDLPSLLRETLGRKKYLLVLDDLWNEDRYEWSKLGDWLEGGQWGSKILVTTRSHEVAKVTNAKSVIHDLRGLSEDESWNLFKKNAFEEGEESLDSEQEKIGRDLVKKCAGVPLAIRTIGSFFYGKKKVEWLRYEGRELLEIPKIDEKDDGIMKVLKFSYNHLPSRLKHCFAYCSLFPKDYVYDKERMIHFWVAQGFIESRNGEDNLEEVADMYLSELLCRSFLDVDEKGDHGEVLTFQMHDLMHDLAQKVA